MYTKDLESDPPDLEPVRNKFKEEIVRDEMGSRNVYNTKRYVPTVIYDTHGNSLGMKYTLVESSTEWNHQNHQQILYDASRVNVDLSVDSQDTTMSSNYDANKSVGYINDHSDNLPKRYIYIY